MQDNKSTFNLPVIFSAINSTIPLIMLNKGHGNKSMLILSLVSLLMSKTNSLWPQEMLLQP